MRWFRFYSEALRDPKVQLLDAETFRRWVNLLCLANEGRPRGQLPGIPEIAYHLRIGAGEADALVDALVARELLDATPDGYRPHNWGGRQFKSDDVGERVASWRASGRNADETAGATLHATPVATPPQRPQGGNVARNVAVTLPATPPETDPEAEPETEQSQIQRGRATPAPARPRATPPGPVPVPSLNELAEAFAPWAAERGVEPAAVREDLGRWRNDVIGRELANRSRRAWLALAEKWLANVDFGPAARVPRRRRGPPAALDRPAGGSQPARTEANLAAIMRTKGG